MTAVRREGVDSRRHLSTTLLVIALLVAGCAALGPTPAPTGVPWATGLPLPSVRATAVATTSPVPKPSPAILTVTSIKYTSSVPISQPADVTFTITNHGNAASQPVWIWFRPDDLAALVDVAYFDPAGATHYGRIADIANLEYGANAIVVPSIDAGKAVKIKLGATINDLGQPVTLVFVIGEGPLPQDSMDLEGAYKATRSFGGFTAKIDAHF